MLQAMLPFVLILFLVVSMYITYQKRKKSGIKGLKSALTSSCCFLIAILNLFAYWFHFGGIFTWLFSIVLLLVGAYFTKYIPISKKVH
ncbi:hypothetical protein QCI77_12065 [Bacillus cereus group sp. MG9]|uniref:hypothetical protein n=1 Tax=Bacillus TaxID=1386 RepID=UPI000DC52245|nr:hypothetical protein [Bacillus mycoides]MBE7129181.1 hypothetical protein [Bacillus mycoides]MEC5238227.1 hypothetical protein [Bacillus mycoides]MEC5262028.1 hypothetical protein [Bacillus mycoides]RAN91734.1 hypothetical protein B5P41_01935 [Bacillus sp. SRB_28]